MTLKILMNILTNSSYGKLSEYGFIIPTKKIKNEFIRHGIKADKPFAAAYTAKLIMDIIDDITLKISDHATIKLDS